ncbi:MAG TPA: sugar phosphate nucleotidyltransferase [Nitrospinota bacterium]|nr:sugar phosphate nucleotidyltransferase [Nitrospinota bacterium]
MVIKKQLKIMNEDLEITKAVIPAAGLGKRLLSISDMVPKEMLPINNKCMIEYSIKEAIHSGIQDIIIIINKRKNILRDYLLERFRDQFKKEPYSALQFIFIYQDEPRGVADAFYLAKDFLKNEPFAVLIPDNIIIGKVPVTLQLINEFRRYKKDLLGITRIDKSNAHLFGNCGRIEFNILEEGVLELTKLHDKGEGTFSLQDENETLRGIARYICTSRLFECIDKIKEKVNGELDDVPAFQEMIEDRSLLGVIVEGSVFDTGHPAGYLAADEYLKSSSHSFKKQE